MSATTDPGRRPGQPGVGTGVDPRRLFEAERPRLMAVAYRMLGTVADAEDVLQDVFERWLAADRINVENPAAYLTTMTTRKSIDRLRSAQKTREVYVGPWLPEPILTPMSAGSSTDPADIVELDESITIGFLHLLEKLTPMERAVHLLHDVFDFPYREIAAMVERDAAHCRQISSRARAKLIASRPERLTAPAPEIEMAVVDAFLAAVVGGDVETVVALLTDDVVHISDGGALRRAARQPVVGPDRVARLLVNLAARLPTPGEGELKLIPLRVNLQRGVLVIVDDEPIVLVVVETTETQVRRVLAIVNPDKLQTVMAAIGADQPDVSH